MDGQARFGDDGVEMKASSTGAQAMELILVDQAMYMKSPDLGTGDKWLKIDLSDPNSLFGMIGKATDPEVMFKAMEAPKKLELVGAEEVDGVETNHYRITMDPTKYLEAMEFPAAMADMLPKELVTEMWVDGDNLPRKFSQTLEVPAAGRWQAHHDDHRGHLLRLRHRRRDRGAAGQPGHRGHARRRLSVVLPHAVIGGRGHSRKTRSSISCSLTSKPSGS